MLASAVSTSSKGGCVIRHDVVLQGVMPLVYTIAVAQAAAAIGHSMLLTCTSPSECTTTDSLHAAIAPHILPFLRRAHILLCQVMNQPPPTPDSQGAAQQPPESHQRQSQKAEVSPQWQVCFGVSVLHTLFCVWHVPTLLLHLELDKVSRQ